jgi:hypothetical protein
MELNEPIHLCSSSWFQKRPRRTIQSTNGSGGGSQLARLRRASRLGEVARSLPAAR